MESSDTTKERWAGYDVEDKETGQGSMTLYRNPETHVVEKIILRNADGSMQTLESYPNIGKLKESLFYDENGVVRKRINIVWAPNGQDVVDIKEFTYDKQGKTTQYESPTGIKRALGQNPYLETLRRDIEEKLGPKFVGTQSDELYKESENVLFRFVEQALGTDKTQ